MAGNLFGGCRHIGQIGIAMRGQRGRHADDDDIHLCQQREIPGPAHGPGQYGKIAVGHCFDIALPGLKLAQLGRVDVETGHGIAVRAMVTARGSPT